MGGRIKCKSVLTWRRSTLRRTIHKLSKYVLLKFLLQKVRFLFCHTSYNSLSFSLYSSCILLTIKKASVAPLPSIKPNCISSTSTNALILFSNTLSDIFIPYYNNFISLCALQVITSPFPL